MSLAMSQSTTPTNSLSCLSEAVVPSMHGSLTSTLTLSKPISVRDVPPITASGTPGSMHEIASCPL
jgi:hypothetical protein